MERDGARHRARGGEDIPALLASGTRLATAAGSVVCLLTVAAIPLARGDDAFQEADVRVAAIALVGLVAALVLGWPVLVPIAIALVGGAYAVELAIDDAPLDLAAPAVAVGLLLVAELAYWSLDERSRAPGDPGQGLRRAAVVALAAIGAFVVASALLALVDDVETGGIALDVVGALATVGALAIVVALAREKKGGSR